MSLMRNEGMTRNQLAVILELKQWGLAIGILGSC